MTNEERQERLRAMRERLHEPLSNHAGATLGIKGRAGIVLAELLDFLASEEPAVVTVETKLDVADGIDGDGVLVALEEARAALWAILRAKGRKITQAEQNDLERWATAAIASIEKALGLGEQSKLRTGPITMPRDAAPGLAPGDVVRLASGGPAMTVLEEDEGELRCGWYDSTADVKMDSGCYPSAALRRVEDEQRRVQRAKECRALLDRAYGSLVGAEAVFRGRGDVDAERVKEDVAETIRVLLQDAADEGLL